MQIRSITMDAVSLATAQAIQKNGAPIQLESNLFGPSCKVTISQEGKNLSRQQVVQSDQNTEDVKEVREQLRQLEKAEQEKKAEEEYREGLNNAEESTLSSPDEDDELKAVLREGFGYWRTDDPNERIKISKDVERAYKELCQKMSEGVMQVSIDNVSDGIIDDKKIIRCRNLKTEDGYHEGLDHAEKTVSSLSSSDVEKAKAEKSGQNIPGLKERRDKVIEGAVEWLRAIVTKSHMTPSMLGKYSEAEMSERIERYCERAREKMYAYFHPTDDFGFTDEELAELNEKLSANQVPLSEQEKAVEEFAKRLTHADHANVTRIEPGDLTTLSDMPQNESL